MRISLLAVVLVLCSSTSFAQASDRESLRGLTGIGVQYFVLDAQLKTIEYPLSELSFDVAASLVKAKIPVFENEDLKDLKGQPCLVITVQVIKSTKDLYMFFVNGSLMQGVYLQRLTDKGTFFYSTTWTLYGKMGWAGEKVVRDDVRNSVAEVVDRFIKEYRAMNPKP